MPKINEMLLKLEGFQCATSLDLNMGYYHIRLSENASNLCTIILPRGKYQYKRLWMGVANSPESFQQKIHVLFHRFEFILACIDNLLIWTKVDRTDYLQKLKFTINKLKGKVLKCNIEMSFFGQTEMEYLGFWVTRDGVKPINEKVESMTNMASPSSRKEVQKFIDVINYCRNMWTRR